MKKNFTYFLCALTILLGNVINVSAQTNLTNEQKQLIQKEVLPAVFKQVNQQFGIDILSFMQPEKMFENVIKSSIASLRSDDWTHTSMDIQPDSVIIHAEIAELDVSKIKLTFSDYEDIQLPVINRYPINLKLPKLTNITTGSLVLDALQLVLHMDPITGDNIISGINISLGTALIGSYDIAKITFEKLPEVKAINDYLEGFNLVINLDGLRESLLLLGVFLPEDLQIEVPDVNFNIPVVPDWEDGIINASLYGIPVQAPTMQIPMGDAKVVLNMQTLSLSNITLTSYEDQDEDGIPETLGWRRLWSTMEQVNSQDLVLTMDDYRFTSTTMTDSVYQGRTVYTMSDYTSQIPTTGALIAKALENVTALLKADQPTWYRMVVEEIDTDDQKEIQQVIEIIPYLEGTNAIARVLIYDYEDGVESETSEIRATASAESELIVVDFLDDLEASSATLYLTSNALNVVGNESTPEVSDIVITNTENGLYATNADGALYSIIHMSGAKVASGYVNGNYIQTPKNKGIYILTINVNGKTHAFKFAK